MAGEADAARMSELGAAGLEMRRARATVRAGLQAGTTSLAEVLASPVHPAVADLSLAEVIRMTRVGVSRAGMESIGRDAVRVKPPVNLMQRAGRAGVGSRAWAASQGEKWADMGARRRPSA